MRILVASHNARHIGGVETYVETVVEGLAIGGSDVAVWHEEGHGSMTRTRGDVPRWIHQQDPESIERARAWGPDVVFTQGLRTPALEHRLLGIAPSVTFAHSYLGTCVSGHKMHRFPTAVPCTRAFGPACLALYYPRRCGGLNPVTALAMYRRQSARLRLLARYRAILVASRHMAQEYARHGFAATTRVVALPASGSPDCPSGPEASASLPTDSARLLYLGRLEWMKGADVAVDCAAAVAAGLGRPVSLIVAGEGSMGAALRQRAARLQTREPRVSYEFAGAVPAEARAALFRRSDLLLVPSRWPEPFGLVGNEAGLHGVPAVAFASGGIVDWLVDGVNGRLVQGTLDTRVFRDAVAGVLRDAPARVSMGQAARLAATRHSLERHLRELDETFRAAREVSGR